MKRVRRVKLRTEVRREQIVQAVLALMANQDVHCAVKRDLGLNNDLSARQHACSSCNTQLISQCTCVALWIMHYTLGAKRFQGYLSKLADGRIYVLPAFWHVETSQWIDFKEITPLPDGDHDFRQIWNVNCFNCHATNIARNIAPSTAHMFVIQGIDAKARSCSSGRPAGHTRPSEAHAIAISPLRREKVAAAMSMRP